MEKQALIDPLDESSQGHYLRRIGFDLRELTRPHPASSPKWWNDHIADDLSYCSQMLCGVRPYQWDAMDRERT